MFQICLISKRFAGHSKWANIKHIKALKDAQKSTLFTKLSKQMQVAAQEGKSTDPNKNLKLSQIIEQARRANMPITTIQSTLTSLQQRKDDCKPGLIEIKGPKGSIILCEIFTSNYNKSKFTIACVIKKHNASFSNGSGRNLFDRKGVIETNILEAGLNESELLELATEHAIESGAEDVRLLQDDTLQFFSESSALASVQNKLKEFKYQIKSACVQYVPNVCVQLNDNELEQVSVLFEKLEQCEDVVNIFDNIS